MHFNRINRTETASTAFGQNRFLIISMNKFLDQYYGKFPFLKLTSHEKHRIRVIFTIREPIKHNKDKLKSLFLELWRLKYLNVVVLSVGKDVEIITYNPFMGNYYQQLAKTTLLKADLFYDKTKNLHQYNLNISLFAEDARVIFSKDGHLAGTDARTSKLIEKYLNANFSFGDRFDSFGEFLPNGTATESLAKIINRDVQMSFNLRIHRIAEFKEKLEVTIINERSDLCIIVPYIGEKSQFGNLFKGFDYTVWILMTTAVVFTSLVWMMTTLMSGDKYYNFTDTLLNIFAVKLGQSLIIMPNKVALQFLAICFLLYAQFITNAFKSNLTSQLLKNVSGTQIDTLSDLAYTEFPLLVYDRYRGFIENGMGKSHQFYTKILKRLKTVNVSEYAEFLANNSEVGFINKKHLTTYYVRERRHIDHGRPIYHEMKDCPVPIVQTYVLPMGSPYLGQVNKLLRRAQEAGLINFWQNYMKTHIDDDRGKLPLQKDTEENTPLGLQHLQAAFSLLALGLGISTIVFFYELFSAYLHRSSKQ